MMNDWKTTTRRGFVLIAIYLGGALGLLARDEVEPAVPSALEELQWMVGSWRHESEGMTVTMTTAWSASRDALQRELEIRLGSSEPVRVSQTIYWDSVTKELRSRGAISDGTTTTGRWTVTGKVARNTCTITFADGRIGTAVNTWEIDELRQCVFSAVKRTIDGKGRCDIAPTEFSPQGGKEQLAVLGR